MGRPVGRFEKTLFEEHRARPGLRSCARENRRSFPYFARWLNRRSLGDGPRLGRGRRGVLQKRALAPSPRPEAAVGAASVPRWPVPFLPVDSRSRETLSQRHEGGGKGMDKGGAACGALNAPLAHPRARSRTTLFGKGRYRRVFGALNQACSKLPAVGLKDSSQTSRIARDVRSAAPSGSAPEPKYRSAPCRGCLRSFVGTSSWVRPSAPRA